MREKHAVCLTQADRCALEALLASGDAPARRLKRAQLLLDADSADGRIGMSDQTIGNMRSVSLATVARLRKLYAKGGLAAALAEPPRRRPRVRKLSHEQADLLRVLAASPPPDGRARWSLRLLAEAMVARAYAPRVSHETVRLVLRERGRDLGGG